MERSSVGNVVCTVLVRLDNAVQRATLRPRRAGLNTARDLAVESEEGTAESERNFLYRRNCGRLYA